MKIEGNLILKEFKVIGKEEKGCVTRAGVITLVSTINQHDAAAMYGEDFKAMAFDHVDSYGNLVYNTIKIKSVNEKHKLSILGFEIDVCPDSPQIKALEENDINKVDVILKVPFDLDIHTGLASELCVNVGNDIKIELIPSQLELPLE